MRRKYVVLADKQTFIYYVVWNYGLRNANRLLKKAKKYGCFYAVQEFIGENNIYYKQKQKADSHCDLVLRAANYQFGKLKKSGPNAYCRVETVD